MSTSKKEKEKFEALLSKAIEEDNLELFKQSLQMSFFKQSPMKYKQSCLNHAVALGYKSENIAKWSLTNTELGFIGDITENANRPLRLAAKLNVNFAKYLLTSSELTKKANIDATNDGSSALMSAIETGNFEFVKYLLTSPDLTRKASLHKGKKEFDDPLCKACTKNQTQIIKYLLTSQDIKNKADISKFDYEALFAIVNQNNIEAFNFILDNNLIDIDAKKEEIFIKAVIADSRAIVEKVETFFEIKPQILDMKDRNKSLFYQLVARSHYGRIERHSFLYDILENTNFLPTEGEKEQMSHFYMFRENQPVQPFSEYLKIREEKINLENIIQNTHSNKKKKL